MAKRKSTHEPAASKKAKAKSSLAPPTTEPADVKAAFRDGLFDEKVLKDYNEQYNTSGPYAPSPPRKTPRAR